MRGFLRIGSTRLKFIEGTHLNKHPLAAMDRNLRIGGTSI